MVGLLFPSRTTGAHRNKRLELMANMAKPSIIHDDSLEQSFVACASHGRSRDQIFRIANLLPTTKTKTDRASFQSICQAHGSNLQHSLGRTHMNQLPHGIGSPCLPIVVWRRLVHVHATFKNVLIPKRLPLGRFAINDSTISPMSLVF